jgi:hypothetical protein
MKFIPVKDSADNYSRADQKTLVTAITLMALGLSILLMNSWDNLFVRTSVGLFWGTFVLAVNWPDLTRTYQTLKQKHDGSRRSGYSSSS